MKSQRKAGKNPFNPSYLQRNVGFLFIPRIQKNPIKCLNSMWYLLTIKKSISDVFNSMLTIYMYYRWYLYFNIDSCSYRLQQLRKRLWYTDHDMESNGGMKKIVCVVRTWLGEQSSIEL